MTTIYLGLDISKDKIDAVTNQTPHITVTNDEAGYRAICTAIKSIPVKSTPVVNLPTSIIWALPNIFTTITSK